ncbi:MAG: ROK family protein [Candidatus Pseudobacter hemicellulosilyticus]|uniref:ROK family protein n=1 Tax=Candidatus Pseudobacter hemicellulosilyticus TaxID=3121375 RepID=A0AAJ6BEY5_9BACT|nr:MAG: ROK family protein [Pseudobacter sp.]
MIKHLYFNKELSCADLSDLTDKSLPYTARALQELMEEGAVFESGHASSTGGRRAQMYSIRHDILYVVAVAMDQFITHVGILDMRNQYVGPVEKIELDLTNNPSALTDLAQYLDAFIGRSGIPKEKIAGIGIGMPGFVDTNQGLNHTFLKTTTGTIVSQVESVTGLPVLIDNDSSLIALAEWKLGAARNKRNAMVINIGWGIGLGLILNGTLFRGQNGFAGEFSHIPLFTNNKICNCGKMGCLETETSLLVIAEKAIAGLKEGRLSSLRNLTPEQVEENFKAIMEAAVRGDKYAVELLSQAAYHIGRGVAILIHVLNPELIVLSGRGAMAGRIWLAPIQQALNEHCIPKMAENIQLLISSLGYEAERLGAAALVMDNLDKLLPQRKLHKINYVS